VSASVDISSLIFPALPHLHPSAPIYIHSFPLTHLPNYPPQTRRNSDLVTDVLELLEELTDSDVVEDSIEEARALTAALTQHGALEALARRLAAADETKEEEAAAVGRVMTICENFIEIDSKV
jgi:hypothetical protein